MPPFVSRGHVYSLDVPYLSVSHNHAYSFGVPHNHAYSVGVSCLT